MKNFIVQRPGGGMLARKEGAKRSIAPTRNFCFKTNVNLIPRILIIT
jgi:hypothetical protein